MQQWSLEENLGNIKLHDDLLDILFKHKKDISLKLSDIRGMFNIDHVSINILNSRNELIIFSSTPSVEFNLIMNGLWKYDRSFLPTFLEDRSLFWWENAYMDGNKKIIKQIKEEMHGYTLGFGLTQKIDTLNLIYSYATRSKEKNLKDYYISHKNDLLLVGDYAFRLLRDIYLLYDHPIVNIKKPYLKLIINND